jgi:hydrogenase expression/formation protein HypC
MCLGVPGKIIDIYEANGLPMGRIDFGGTLREACLAYVPEAAVGDYTLIHVGFAISVLSEEEAQATMEALRELVDIEEEIGPGVGETAGNPPRPAARKAP